MRRFKEIRIQEHSGSIREVLDLAANFCGRFHGDSSNNRRELKLIVDNTCRSLRRWQRGPQPDFTPRNISFEFFKRDWVWRGDGMANLNFAHLQDPGERFRRVGARLSSASPLPIFQCIPLITESYLISSGRAHVCLEVAH